MAFQINSNKRAVQRQRKSKMLVRELSCLNQFHLAVDLCSKYNGSNKKCCNSLYMLNRQCDCKNSDRCVLIIEETLLKYKKCKNTIENVKLLADEADVLLKDPDFFIYENFNEIRVLIDLRREKMKFDIDTTSDQLIESINLAELQCRMAMNNISRLNKQMDKTNETLKHLIADFNTLELNDSKLNWLTIEVDQLQTTYQNEIIRLKADILRENDLKFECEDIQIEKIFGSLSNQKKIYFEDSSILTNFQDQINLVNLAEFSDNQQFKLVYKGSTDGFTAAKFHEKCDNIKGTLTIIKTTNDCVFGGFTNESWEGDFMDKLDPSAFIFSYINKQNLPIKIKCEPNRPAIRCCSKIGPLFGSTKPDLVILDNSNVNFSSYSQLIYSYKIPVHLGDSDRASCFLVGQPKFQTIEIEVYQKL